MDVGAVSSADDVALVAICPNSNAIWIYTKCQAPDVADWEKKYELNKHDLLVTGIDWSAANNKIVSCSHDRNAFVWEYSADEDEWKPQLVVLNLTRACLDVQWSADGEKFAVGSGMSRVAVSSYDKEGDWWVSKLMKHHSATVGCVRWHPVNSQLLATACFDGKFRLMCANIKEVDGAVDTSPFAVSGAKFGKKLISPDLPTEAWCHTCAWSPSGGVVAFATHDSYIHILTIAADPSGPTTIQSIRCKAMPYTSLLFASDTVLIAAGHDFNPHLYVHDGTEWVFKTQADKMKAAAASTATSSFSSARARFGGGNRAGGAKTSTGTLKTKHHGLITQLRALPSAGGIDRFSSTGVDGKLVIWDLATALAE